MLADPHQAPVSDHKTRDVSLKLLGLRQDDPRNPGDHPDVVLGVRLFSVGRGVVMDRGCAPIRGLIIPVTGTVANEIRDLGAIGTQFGRPEHDRFTCTVGDIHRCESPAYFRCDSQVHVRLGRLRVC